MRITTKAVYDIETGKLLEWQGYDYEGPIATCTAGAGPAQTNVPHYPIIRGYGIRELYRKAALVAALHSGQLRWNRDVEFEAPAPDADETQHQSGNLIAQLVKQRVAKEYQLRSLIFSTNLLRQTWQNEEVVPPSEALPEEHQSGQNTLFIARNNYLQVAKNQALKAATGSILRGGQTVEAAVEADIPIFEPSWSPLWLGRQLALQQSKDRSTRAARFLAMNNAAGIIEAAVVEETAYVGTHIAHNTLFGLARI